MQSKLRSNLLDSEHFSHPGVKLLGKVLLHQQVKRDGYCWIPGQQYFLSTEKQAYWNQLAVAWNHLVPDMFLSDGGRYRERRLGKYHFYPHLNRLEKNMLRATTTRTLPLIKAMVALRESLDRLRIALLTTLYCTV